MQHNIVMLPVAEILADQEHNPRPIDHEHVTRLADSFKKTGGEDSLITNPIAVTDMPENEHPDAAIAAEVG